MRVFGIIGYPLTHSFSQKYFTEKFEQEHISDATFLQFPIENIDALSGVLLDHPNLKGFAVTIPHKKSVLQFLHDATDAVQEMGAANCILLKDGKLYGYNTDVVGFEKSFAPLLQPHHTKALILGTGGAAAAVEYTLRKQGITYKFVSRTKSEDNLTYDELNEEVMQAYTVVINTTPLGTFPKVDEAAAIPYHLLTPRHYLFDLVYNPAETKFLRLGKEQGAVVKNGHDMLIIQAEENWKIWNSNN
ncbi:MAG: shikimate dehydrogenase [Filimonas sp.]|nr:shikimate dehydrogenase [Filimonas sp.]